MKKDISSMKKKNIVNKKNKVSSGGFTLIELLASIAILSIVLSIVAYFVFDVIRGAREKSYQVTINNIQSQASNYVLEKFSSFDWIDIDLTSNQYQCVKVKNLIEAGYFKGDVLESKVQDDLYVLEEDFIYLEREANTKNITKSVLLYGDYGTDKSYGALCPDARTSSGEISFNLAPSGWSKQKDISITYKLKNVSNVSDYKYSYSYADNNGVVDTANVKSNVVFGDKTELENLLVNNNGSLLATISDGLASKTLIVDGIDLNPPTISIISSNNVANKQTVTLNMADSESGVLEYYFGKDNPQTNKVVWNKYSSAKASVVESSTVDSAGTWYLAAKDAVGNMRVDNKVFYKTELSVSNASVNPTSVITMFDNSFTIPDAVADTYYTFNGWYNNSRYTDTALTSYKPNSNSTLYGKTTENKLVGGIVSITGDVTYGETISANIVEDTTPKADNYAYQWYYSGSSNKNNSQMISGATSKTLYIEKEYVDNYVYVVVTATKNNYRSTSFDDITNKVAKRPITVTANSNSKVYDGTELKDSGCSADNLLTGDNVVCEMTADSKITNVGSKTNKINKVTISNGTKDDYYSVTKVDGTLTITEQGVSIPTADVYCSKTKLIYNGSEQTITTGSGSGYTFSGHKQKNAGAHTVTAKLNGDYIWEDGTKTDKTFVCHIDKATPTIIPEPSVLNLFDVAGTSKYTYNGDGLVTCYSNNDKIATCSVNQSKGIVSVVPLEDGNTTIVLNASETNNYVAASTDISVSVEIVSNVLIKYNSNGGTGTMSDTTCTYGGACSISKNGFTKTGNKFIGWTTNSDGTADSFGWTGWSGTWNFSNGTKGVSNNTLTLYAMWEPNKVYIHYFVNGGTIKSKTLDTTETPNLTFNWSLGDDGIIIRNGEVMTTTINYGESTPWHGVADHNNEYHAVITKTGHSAISKAEWKCKSGNCSNDTYDELQVYAASDFCDASNDDCTVEIEVNWKANEYTITYDANGGYSSRHTWDDNAKYCTYNGGENHDVTGTMKTQTCTYGQSCTLNKNEYSRQCHNFLGWTTNDDTDTVNYTNSITSNDDTDAFYGNKDNFTYNIANDIVLYAVWESDHDFDAGGNQIVITNRQKFTCGHSHYSHGAYVRYCSKCHMSAGHYDMCYRPAYSTGDYANQFCPCKSGLVDVTLDDHGAFYSSASYLDKENWTASYKFGGIVEGKSKLKELGDGFLANYVCADHNTYTVTLNQTGGTGGTDYVYGVVRESGFGLFLSNTDGVYSEEMTSSKNKISVPTQCGYIFGGYYTGIDGSGTMIIDSTGYLTDNFDCADYSADFTLHAKWTKSIISNGVEFCN